MDTHHTTHFQLSFNAIIINIISMSGNFSGDHNIFRHMQKKLTITLKFCQILSKLKCNFYHHICWPEINEWVPYNVLPFKRDTPLSSHSSHAFIQKGSFKELAFFYLLICGGKIFFLVMLFMTFRDVACFFLKWQKGDFCQK